MHDVVHIRSVRIMGDRIGDLGHAVQVGWINVMGKAHQSAPTDGGFGDHNFKVKLPIWPAHHDPRPRYKGQHMRVMDVSIQMQIDRITGHKGT